VNFEVIEGLTTNAVVETVVKEVVMRMQRHLDLSMVLSIQDLLMSDLVLGLVAFRVYLV
jgi:hypothetical protein